MTDQIDWAGHERPRARKDLCIEEVVEETFAAHVIDRRFSKRVKLDRPSLAVFRLLDGTHDLAAILRDLDRQGLSMRASLVIKAIEFFDRNLLLEGPRLEASAAGEISVEEQRVVLKAEPGTGIPVERIYFLDEARHGCVGCGQCCTGYEFGPLSDEEVERLSGESVPEEDGTPAVDRAVVEKEFDGVAYHALAVAEDGACVFQDRAGLCTLHREKGPQAKPWFCQLFPVRFVMAPDGKVFGHLQMECFAYHEARKAGPYLAEIGAAIRPLLALARNVPILTQEVQIGTDRTLTLQEYYRAEQWMLQRVASDPGGAEASLYAMGCFVRHLETGGSLQDFAPPPCPAPLGENDELVRRVTDFARGSVASVSPALLAGKPEGTSPGMRRFFLEAVEFFSGEGDPEDLLAAEEVRGPSEDGEGAAILREYLRNEIFSKAWYLWGDLRRGLALTVTCYLLTVAGARLVAAHRGEAAVHPEALCRALSIVLRNLRRRRVEELVAKEDSPAVRIYTALVGDGAQR